MVNDTWPECLACSEESKQGKLLPLSDFGGQGAPVHYKAWVCSRPGGGFNLKIRNGDVYVNEPVSSGSTHSPRIR